MASLSRYGNQPIIKRWNYRVDKRLDRVPVRDMDGKITGYEFEEREYVVHNEPSNQIIPIESMFTDRHIEDLQDQVCIVIKDDFDLSTAYDMEAAGEAINIDKIKKCHYSRGSDTNSLHGQHEENRGVEDGDDSETDLLEGHHIWAKVPIVKDGDKYVWDAKKNKPVWWWGVFVGRINGSSGEKDPTTLCLCLRRNYDPDDEFPGFMGHLLPDNEDCLYHVAPCQIIETLYDQLVTKQNQAIDNVPLMNRRPLLIKKGNVFTKNLKYEPDAVWVTENGREDIQEADVVSNTGDTLGMVQYLDGSCDRALGTDKPIVGEAMGGRTSATEAQNIMEQASKPYLMIARYAIDPLLEWDYKKDRSYWHLYAKVGQVAEITGIDEREQIKPAELFGDFEVEVDVVGQYVDDAMAQQSLNYFTQTLPNMPHPELVNWKEIYLAMFERFKLGQNPAKFIVEKQATDAKRLATLENDMLINGKWDAVEDTDDHDVHLRIHEGLKIQYANLTEGEDYPAGQLMLLDQHIQEHQFRKQMAAQQMAQQAPPQGPNESQTPGAVVGDQIAAQMGGGA